MNTDKRGLLHNRVTEKVLGAFFDVYNELGFGFLESVYVESLAIDLRIQGLQVDRQMSVPVWFRNQLVGTFRADLVVESVVIVELKAALSLDPSHEAQLLNYLRATEIEVGLLLNFGPKPQFKRLIFDNPRKSIRENPCLSVAALLTSGDQ